MSEQHSVHELRRDMQTPIPAEIATWARGRVGNHLSWALPNDLSGARSWRMSSSEGIIELRVLRTHGDFQREVYAHRNAIPHLGAGRAPRLLGFEPRLRALLTLEPRGERVDDAPERGLHLMAPVHEQAGQLLRSLHDSAVRVGDRHAQAVRNTVLYIDYVDRLLDQIDSSILDGQRTVIRRRLDVVRERAPQLPSAFCHGSFGSSCWRWQRAQRTLVLTGFRRSQMMAASLDFARPSLLWADRPQLRAAFTRGYGRPFNQLEQRLLNDFAVVATVEDLRNAIRLQDSEAHAYVAVALRAAMNRLQIPDIALPTRLVGTEAPPR
ncbi:hypothetical protein [Streptomyces sp. NPDC006140]|uniref:hypothetical protein n=1 Tax=Streptomyces sp. NPDC006140 TaxID=3154579 RepID=UPI0033D29016